jgi:hypothetical protein
MEDARLRIRGGDPNKLLLVDTVLLAEKGY